MLKKIIPLLLCIFTAAALCAAPKIKVNQQSKEAAVETFLKAAAFDDAEAMWELILPDMQEKFIKLSGSKAQAIKEFWKGFRQSCPPGKSDSFKQIVNDSKSKTAVIRYLVENAPDFLVQKNGKWYIVMEKSKH